MKQARFALSVMLCLVTCGASMGWAQEPAVPGTVQKYKLTIVEGASTSKRAKKGRVSSQSVVKITDQNDVPVAGIAVTFAIPQFVGGASFASGGLTSVVATNAAGIASSGAFTSAAGSSFSIGVAAAAPGGTLTATVPVTTAAVAAGVSTGVVVGVVVAVAVATGVGLGVGLTHSGGSSPTTIGLGSATVIH